MDDLHEWVEQRLLGRALATLNDGDAARLDEHVRACARCRERLAELTAETSADPAARGHLPAAMIARWQRAGAQLAGLEREAVRLHLKRCAACREELRLLGHTAELAPAAQLAPAAEPSPASGRRAPDRPRPWRQWLTGGAIGALATAAALLSTLRPIATEPQTAGGDGPTAPTLTALPWAAPASLRGAEVELRVPAGTREIAVAVAAPPVTDASIAHTVTVWGPDATRLASLGLPAESIVAGTAFVLLRMPVALAAGTYRVVVRSELAEGAAGGAGTEGAAGDAGTPGAADAAADSTESFFELALVP